MRNAALPALPIREGLLETRILKADPLIAACAPVGVAVPGAGDSLIEEGLANAARHGDASSVVIAGRIDDTLLTLSIEDDGSRRRDAGTSAATGIGLRWLDRIAPGDWALTHGAAGSLLVVKIR